MEMININLQSDEETLLNESEIDEKSAIDKNLS